MSACIREIGQRTANGGVIAKATYFPQGKHAGTTFIDRPDGLFSLDQFRPLRTTWFSLEDQELAVCSGVQDRHSRMPFFGAYLRVLDYELKINPATLCGEEPVAITGCRAINVMTGQHAPEQELTLSERLSDAHAELLHDIVAKACDTLSDAWFARGIQPVRSISPL